VGFQTKMKYGAQKTVLKMIPGLETAEFARLGGIHRNTFINSQMCALQARSPGLKATLKVPQWGCLQGAWLWLN